MKGFSLIELLVALAILSIVLAVGAFTSGGYITKYKEQSAVSTFCADIVSTKWSSKRRNFAESLTFINGNSYMAFDVIKELGYGMEFDFSDGEFSGTLENTGFSVNKIYYMPMMDITFFANGTFELPDQKPVRVLKMSGKDDYLVAFMRTGYVQKYKWIDEEQLWRKF